MPNPNLPINFRKNTYIGARYVPKFSDTPGAEWDNSIQYEPLTIVVYQGNSYTSKTFVPVGVDINNDTYWAVTGNYNAQVESLREQVVSLSKEVSGLWDNSPEFTKSNTGNIQGKMTYFKTTNNLQPEGIAINGNYTYISAITPSSNNGKLIKILDGNIILEQEATIYHSNAIAVSDDNFLYSCDSYDNVEKHGMGSISIFSASNLAFIRRIQTNLEGILGIYYYNGVLYGLDYDFRLIEIDTQTGGITPIVTLVKNTNALPQGFAMNDDYIFWAFSGSNSIAVYSRAGDFLTFVNIGEVIVNGGICQELENLFVKDNKIYLLSANFYYGYYASVIFEVGYSSESYNSVGRGSHASQKFTVGSKFDFMTSFPCTQAAVDKFSSMVNKGRVTIEVSVPDEMPINLESEGEFYVIYKVPMVFQWNILKGNVQIEGSASADNFNFNPVSTKAVINCQHNTPAQLTIQLTLSGAWTNDVLNWYTLPSGTGNLFITSDGNNATFRVANKTLFISGNVNFNCYFNNCAVFNQNTPATNAEYVTLTGSNAYTKKSVNVNAWEYFKVADIFGGFKLGAEITAKCPDFTFEFRYHANGAATNIYLVTDTSGNVFLVSAEFYSNSNGQMIQCNKLVPNGTGFTKTRYDTTFTIMQGR